MNPESDPPGVEGGGDSTKHMEYPPCLVQSKLPQSLFR